MRLIDADALKESIHCSDTDEKKVLSTKQLHEILDKWIDAQPTIEERKGEWKQIKVSYFADMDDETKTGMAIASMFCPRCKRYHNEVYLYGNPTFGVNFCPNCGADMRKQP